MKGLLILITTLFSVSGNCGLYVQLNGKVKEINKKYFKLVADKGTYQISRTNLTKEMDQYLSQTGVDRSIFLNLANVEPVETK